MNDMPIGAGRSADQPPSVFVAPDQGEMIARLDAVTDDDLDSTFFSTSVQEAEDAAVRMFDVGIRTLGDEADARALPLFPGLAPAPQAPSAPSLQEPPLAGAPPRGLSFDDPRVRTAFVLGGPGALSDAG